MSKKDYQSLAAEFAAVKIPPDAAKSSEGGHAAEAMRSNLARRVASVLKADNPSFDRARFLKAAEVEE